MAVRSSTDFASRDRSATGSASVWTVQPRQEVPSALRRLAQSQAGVLSREQVLGLGLSSRVIERLIATDRWRPLARGIYLTVASDPSWDALAWGGVLAGGLKARLGPRSSGHLHRLIEASPDPVDVLVPAANDVRRAGPWQFLRERPDARSPRSVGSPPRLTVEATVLDLCACSTEGEVVGLITTAVQRRLTTPRRLSRAMDARSRQRHRRLIKVLLEMYPSAPSRYSKCRTCETSSGHMACRGGFGSRAGTACATSAMSVTTSTPSWSSSTAEPDTKGSVGFVTWIVITASPPWAG